MGHTPAKLPSMADILPMRNDIQIARSAWSMRALAPLSKARALMYDTAPLLCEVSFAFVSFVASSLLTLFLLSPNIGKYRLIPPNTGPLPPPLFFQFPLSSATTCRTESRHCGRRPVSDQSVIFCKPL